MNKFSKEKTMTVKEVANVYGCAENTILNSIRELFPEIIRNGKITYLNEIQVTAIKLKLDKHHNLSSTCELPKTDLEKELIINQAMLFQQEKVNKLKAENLTLNSTVKMLVHDFEKVYTTREIAKELNLKSAQKLNKILVEKRIQYKQNKTWLLYSNYSDKGYNSIKEHILDNGKITYDRLWTGKGRQFILELLSYKTYNLNEQKDIDLFEDNK